MRILSAAEVEAALDWESLIERLRQTFRRGAEAPPGHHHDIANPAGAAGRLSLGPAWQSGRHIGLRIATDFPDNPARGLPAAMGAYLLLDGRSGARATRRRSPGPGFSSTAVRRRRRRRVTSSRPWPAAPSTPRTSPAISSS